MSLLTNLECYFQLDESSGATAIDAQGTANLGDTGTVGTGTGILNGCRTFNGSNYLSSGAASFQLNGSTQFTYTGWVKPSSTPGGGQGILAQGYGANFYFHQQSNNLKLNIFAPSAPNQLFNTLTLTQSSVLSGGVWTFFAFWYDSSANSGAGSVNLQVNNGTIVTENAGSGPVGTGSGNPFYIGCQDFVDNFFNGSIDEVGYWKGRCLDSTERTTLYNSGAGYPYSSFAPPAGQPTASRFVLNQNQDLWLPTFRPIEIGRQGVRF